MSNSVSVALHPLAKLGVLTRWRKEVSRGDSGQIASRPSTWKYDELWRAACYEAAAIEYEHMGLHSAAEDALARAAMFASAHTGAKEIIPSKSRDPWKDAADVAVKRFGVGQGKGDPFRGLFR